jgi:hypothetical protein
MYVKVELSSSSVPYSTISLWQSFSLATADSGSWITRTVSGNALTINFFAISDAEDQNHQTIVFDLTDEPVIADAIFPELPKPRAVQRLSNAAWVGQLGNPRMKELQDALAVLRVEFVEFPVNLG